MAYEIAIINPRSIKRRRKAGKKGASKMAKKRRRKMTAKQRKYFGPKRRKAASVAAAPRKRRRRAAAGKRRPAVGYVVGSKRIRRRKLNPRVRSYRHRRHSNPRFSVAGITNQLIPAAYGAAGGLVLDVGLGYIPLPDMLKTGYARHATRIVAALGIGYLGSKFLRGKGAMLGQGALTIAVYGLLKDVAAKTLGDKVKGLGDYEEITMSGFSEDGIGAYLNGPSEDATDPASVVGVGAYMGDIGDEDVVLSGVDF